MTTEQLRPRRRPAKRKVEALTPLCFWCYLDMLDDNDRIAHRPLRGAAQGARMVLAVMLDTGDSARDIAGRFCFAHKARLNRFKVRI